MSPELHMLPPPTEFEPRVPSEDFDEDDFWTGAWCGGCTRERRRRRQQDRPASAKAPAPRSPPAPVELKEARKVVAVSKASDMPCDCDDDLRPFIQVAEARKAIAVNKTSDAPCNYPDDDLELAAAIPARNETNNNVSVNAHTKVTL